MELPVTECAWRAWRRDLDAWLQECESLVSSYHRFLLEDASRGALPRIKQNWGMVPVPGGVPWNLAMVRHQERGLAAEACRFAANQLGNTTNAFAAYRQTKAVYRVEPRLWADLAAAKFPAKYPMEHFLLPSQRDGH